MWQAPGMELLTLLGPLELEDGPIYSLFALREGQLDSSSGATPDEALRRLLARRSDRSGLEVDAQFASLAIGAGLPIREPSAEELALIGHLAIGLAAEGLLVKITDPTLISGLADASRSFLRAEPWRYFDSDVGCAIAVRGVSGRERELTVLGSSGEEPGLFVFDRPGIIAAMNEADDDEAAVSVSMDAIVVYFKTAPAFAQAAVQRGLGLSHVPVLQSFAASKAAVVRPDALRVLIAAMHATVAVVEQRGPATGEFLWRGKGVSVEVTPGEGFDPDGLPASVPQYELEQSPAHRLDQALREKLAVWVAEEDGPTTAPPALRDHPLLLAPYTAYLHAEGGRTIARRFAARLSEEELAWVEAQERAPMTVLQVEECSPEEGLVIVRDRLSGAQHRVAEGRLSPEVVRHDGYAGRLVEFQGETLLCGCTSSPLGPEQTDRLVELSRPLAAQGAIRGPDGLLALLRLAEEARVPPGAPARLETTDGEPYVGISDELVLSCSAQEAIRTLEQLSGVGRAETSRGERTLSITHPGNAVHPYWRNTCVATVRVAGRSLHLETSSIDRAARVRAEVEAALGDRVKFRGRTLQAPPQIPAILTGLVKFDSCRAGDPAHLAPLGELELFALLAERLGDGAPPAADRLAQVHTTLCEREHRVERACLETEEEPPMQLPLRRMLGISADGRWLGPDRALLRRGGLLSLGDLLGAFAAAIFPELLDVGRKDRDALALTIEAWKLSRRGATPEALEEACLARRTGPTAAEEAPLRWMVELFRTSLAWDERVILDWHVVDAAQFASRIAWHLEDDREPAHVPLAWDPETQTDPEEWALVPAQWRTELVADMHRLELSPLGADFAAHIARHVELEDALAGRPLPELLATIDALDEALGDRHEALDLIVEALVASPNVKVTHGAALRGLLKEVEEEPE